MSDIIVATIKYLQGMWKLAWVRNHQETYFWQRSILKNIVVPLDNVFDEEGHVQEEDEWNS